MSLTGGDNKGYLEGGGNYDIILIGGDNQGNPWWRR